MKSSLVLAFLAISMMACGGSNPPDAKDPTTAAKDADGDGVPDDKDKCPDKKEDGQSPDPADGCPKDTAAAPAK